MKPKSEAEVQKLLQIAASQQGNRLWRNNRGYVTGDDGRVIRFGLCNESKRIGDHLKSSDLIGITQVNGVAVFTSVEVKKPGWVYRGTSTEAAQLRWIELIKSMGGIAYFSTGELL